MILQTAHNYEKPDLSCRVSGVHRQIELLRDTMKEHMDCFLHSWKIEYMVKDVAQADAAN